MADPRTMLCAYCGTTRRWREDFPLATEAKCRACCEADEQAERAARSRSDATMATVVVGVLGAALAAVVFSALVARGACG